VSGISHPFPSRSDAIPKRRKKKKGVFETHTKSAIPECSAEEGGEKKKKKGRSNSLAPRSFLKGIGEKGKRGCASKLIDHAPSQFLAKASGRRGGKREQYKPLGISRLPRSAL